MAVSQYRLTVIGPGDEVLDEIPLDGFDAHQPYSGIWLQGEVEMAMGVQHVRACAALPDPEPAAVDG